MQQTPQGSCSRCNWKISKLRGSFGRRRDDMQHTSPVGEPQARGRDVQQRGSDLALLPPQPQDCHSRYVAGADGPAS